MDAWDIPLLLCSIELNKSKQLIFQQTMWLEPCTSLETRNAYLSIWVGDGKGWGGAITIMSIWTRMHCTVCSLGGVKVGLGGAITFMFHTHTHTSCYALGSSLALAHTHTHVMLRSGILSCTCTHTWDLLLHSRTHTQASCYALRSSLVKWMSWASAFQTRANPNHGKLEMTNGTKNWLITVATWPFRNSDLYLWPLEWTEPMLSLN